jgi:hypothetical protein
MKIFLTPNGEENRQFSVKHMQELYNLYCDTDYCITAQSRRMEIHSTCFGVGGGGRRRHSSYIQNFDEDIPGTLKRRTNHKIKMNLREVHRGDHCSTSLPRNSTNALL